jgi:signal transduction histidine kinase
MPDENLSHNPIGSEPEMTMSKLSHDLRNNLTVIKGHLALFDMQDKEALSPELKKLLSVIKQEVSSMEALIRKAKA